MIKEALARQGFVHSQLELEYPGLHSLHINYLTFQKKLSGHLAQVELNNIVLEYQISRLIHGNFTRILIGNGTVALSSIASSEPEPLAESSELPPKQPLTVDELLKPLPPLPFQELVLGDVLIHREQAKDPLQDLTLNGSVNGENGFLNSHFIIEGPHIPAYELTWSGTSIGDAFLRLKSQKTPLPLIFFRSQKTQIQDTLDLQGSLEVDLSKMVKFVELFFPVHADITNLKGTIQATLERLSPEIHASRIRYGTKSRKGGRQLSGKYGSA